ncbi:hypothetical protein [Microcoleus sp. bin38.metabat.b11b12b14.051]|uniref:hypothetical protein n=1 Tax=Microcoleus sp. bin38.metabat.b11b12b14.051 TaxID=2742709 RepID=UPI002600B084|nr:hypothetical protein [Microcoleus sp. bin38.metabat.b11b12b14.051]
MSHSPNFGKFDEAIAIGMINYLTNYCILYARTVKSVQECRLAYNRRSAVVFKLLEANTARSIERSQRFNCRKKYIFIDRVI